MSEVSLILGSNLSAAIASYGAMTMAETAKLLHAAAYLSIIAGAGILVLIFLFAYLNGRFVPAVSKPRSGLRRWLARVVDRATLIVGVAFVLSFISFLGTHIAFLDGDALNGRVADGQYFLASHGGQFEVTAPIWFYSLAHAWLTFTTGLAWFGLLSIHAIVVGQRTSHDQTSNSGRTTLARQKSGR